MTNKFPLELNTKSYLVADEMLHTDKLLITRSGPFHVKIHLLYFDHERVNKGAVF